MSIHEQARAEAEKRRYLFTTPGEDENLRSEFVAGAVWAATRTRVVTTVTELDALPVGSVVLDRHGEAWRKTRTGDWIAAALGCTTSSGVPRPARVLYVPED